MLEVWSDGVLSGRLDRVGSDPRRCAFAYDPSARPSEEVSLTMPLKLAGDEYPDGLHPVLQMNLPEGRSSVLRPRAAFPTYSPRRWCGMRGGFGPIAQAMRRVWEQGVTCSLVG